MARKAKTAEPPTGLAGMRKEFLKDLEEFSGRGMQRVSDAFREWARMACLPVLSGVAKFTGDVEAHARYEKEYAQTVKRRMDYCDAPVTVGGRMLARVVDALELERRDFLGFCMEELAATNPALGQFFTPKDVARMMAKVSMGNGNPVQRDGDGLVSVYEPACGCGVILIEACGILQEQGVAQRDVWVEGEDVDACAASCCYLQLSLLGVAGVVRRGNTLTMQFSETMVTPGAYLHGTIWRWRRRQRREREAGAGEDAAGRRPAFRKAPAGDGVREKEAVGGAVPCNPPFSTPPARAAVRGAGQLVLFEEE